LRGWLRDRGRSTSGAAGALGEVIWGKGSTFLGSRHERTNKKRLESRRNKKREPEGNKFQQVSVGSKEKKIRNKFEKCFSRPYLSQ